SLHIACAGCLAWTIRAFSMARPALLQGAERPVEAPNRISLHRAGSAEPSFGGKPESDIQRALSHALAEISILISPDWGGPSRPKARHGNSVSATMRGWSAPK